MAVFPVGRTRQSSGGGDDDLVSAFDVIREGKSGQPKSKSAAHVVRSALLRVSRVSKCATLYDRLIVLKLSGDSNSASSARHRCV